MTPQERRERIRELVEKHRLTPAEADFTVALEEGEVDGCVEAIVVETEPKRRRTGMSDDLTKAREAVQRVQARLDALERDRKDYQEEHGIVPKGYDLSDPTRTPAEVTFVDRIIAHDQCLADLTEAVEALLAIAKTQPRAD